MSDITRDIVARLQHIDHRLQRQEAQEQMPGGNRLTLRPQLYAGRVGGVAKPTFVVLGAYAGYSFPIYASDEEQLFFRESIPGRWDGASNINAYAVVMLSAAEDVGDKFQFQLSWASHVTGSGALASAAKDARASQAVAAGRSAQYSIYVLTFVVGYTLPTPDLAAGDHFGGRIRRIAATAPQVSNEIILLDFYMTYNVNKIFKSV